jgi:hypothetical protein
MIKAEKHSKFLNPSLAHAQAVPQLERWAVPHIGFGNSQSYPTPNDKLHCS